MVLKPGLDIVERRLAHRGKLLNKTDHPLMVPRFHSYVDLIDQILLVLVELHWPVVKGEKDPGERVRPPC